MDFVIPKNLKNKLDSFKDLIVTRFPPEPSGYLHLGHVKAIYINKFIADKYHGKFILRFDDTNCKNESLEYEHAIMDDITNTLKIKPDSISYCSQYFDKLIQYADWLVKNGLAFVDTNSQEIIKEERHQNIESVCRNTSIEDNLKLWTEMKNGQINNCVLRLKIDMKNDNACLRDPAIYRRDDIQHYKTGSAFKVYPTYDFACPVADHLDGITHVFRSTEFSERDEQYKIILKMLGLKQIVLESYGKLTIKNKVMSKRLIKSLIERKKVTGWDDPSLYTLRGCINRGLHLNALNEFITKCGFSKAIVNMEPETLWSINKKHIDQISTRYIVLPKHGNITIRIKINGQFNDFNYTKEIDRFQKNKTLGKRDIAYSSEILLNSDEIKECLNKKVTLLNWGNFILKEQYLDYLELDTDFKSTPKLSWLAKDCVNIKIKKFGPIVTTEYLGEPTMLKINKGDYLQLYKMGYYICESIDQINNEIVLIECC